MKKSLLTVLAVALVVAPAMADQTIYTNENQNFEGTVVKVAVPTAPVVVGSDAAITITLTHNPENVKGSGAIPQVSFWVGGEQVAYWDEVKKNKSVSYTIKIDTSAAGAQAFDIEVWTRLGNKNFADLLFGATGDDAVVIEIVAPEEDDVPWAKGQWITALQEALNAKVADDGGTLVYEQDANGKTYIVLTVKGEEFTFVSNGTAGSTMECAFNGWTFSIVISNGKIPYEVK